MKKRTFKFRVVIKRMAKDDEEEVVLQVQAPNLDEANKMLWNFCRLFDAVLLKVIRVVII